jgi:hypothetical protein
MAETTAATITASITATLIAAPNLIDPDPLINVNAFCLDNIERGTPHFQS